jgi:hypothetical protein
MTLLRDATQSDDEVSAVTSHDELQVAVAALRVGD